MNNNNNEKVTVEVELNGKKRAMTYSQEDAETMMKYHGIDMKEEVKRFIMQDLEKEAKQ